MATASPSSQSLTQRKALTLFDSVEAEGSEEAAGETLKARRGRCRRCKQRGRLPHLRGPSEAAGADGEAAASSPGGGAEIVQEGAYTDQQIISVDKVALYWKKMPSRTFPGTSEMRKEVTVTHAGVTLP